MQLIFDYILKLSVSLAVVYIFYQLVLRKLTFYNWNRWYLLGYTAFAFLIPLMDVTGTLDKNEWSKSVILQYIPVIEVNEKAEAVAERSHTWTPFDWLFVLLVSGMLVLIIKFVLRYLSFLKVRARATLLADGDTKLFMVEEDIIPFSFGNNIFINNQFQDEAELKEIIRHEFVHVKQKHTHDIIWSELLCILNWYNPFVWLIRKAIRQNLEFIADGKVLEQGYDKKKYQYLLLKVIGNNHFSIANQFNFSSLKKRIVMMNKMKSARAQLIKFLFIVPLVAVMLLAFRNERNGNKKQDKSYTVGQKDFTDTIPPPPPPTPAHQQGPPPPPHPPGPPPPPAPPKLPENVKSITITDVQMTVVLKDGTVEKYDMTKEEEKKAFHKKYGRFFGPPPPPPHPGVFVAPGSEINESIVNPVSTPNGLAVGVDSNVPVTVAGQAQSITSVTAPVHVDGKLYGVTATTPIHTDVNVHGITAVTAPIHATSNVEEVVVTGHPLKSTVSTSFPVRTAIASTVAIANDEEVGAGVHTITSSGMQGDKYLELRISKYASREKLDQLIAEAKAKDVELKFDNMEFDNGKLVKLAGKIEKGDSKSNFSVGKFESISLVVTKENGKYNCLVWLSNEKEVQ